MRAEWISFRRLLMIEAAALGLVLAFLGLPLIICVCFFLGLLLGCGRSSRKLLHAHKHRVLGTDGVTIVARCQCGDEVSVSLGKMSIPT
jgi:hypothetical protein